MRKKQMGAGGDNDDAGVALAWEMLRGPVRP